MAIIPNTDPNAVNPIWANQGAPSPGGGEVVTSTDPLAAALASTLSTNRGGGGGGGGGNGVAAGVDDALAPMTGFASRYTPAMATQAYENPWYILRDLFPGISESDPLYQAMRDLGGDPLTLFNISQGANQKIDQGASDFINWLAQLYQQQGTRGGQAIDPQALIGNLFGQTEFGADAENTLGQILGAGDMGTQVRTLFNMLRDVSNTGMNPLAARGYQSAIAQAGDRYGNAQMKAEGGSTMNPTEWISQNMPWLAGR